jgi:hypothetical protein
MPFGEKNHEIKDKPHPIEKHPPKPDLTRAIGQTAIKGASKDKPKK